MLSDRLTFNQKTKVVVACSLIGFISLLILVDLLVNTRDKTNDKKDGSVVISKGTGESNDNNSPEKSLDQLIKEIEQKEIEKLASNTSDNNSMVEKGATTIDGSVEETAVNNNPEIVNYVVEQGDSYWIIARKLYGKGSYWKKIANINPSIDPKRLRKGMNLKVPKEINSTNIVKGERKIDSSRVVTILPDEYVVRKGDTLWNVAKLVDKGETINEKITILVSANKDKIDGYSLIPGTKLQIP